jgi:putative membrane protein
LRCRGRWPCSSGPPRSFIVGFKNAQTYNRTVEGQQVWTSIAGLSRYWGTISRDFPTSPRCTKPLVYRHLAWLTVLRYELRSGRVWESVTSRANVEYRDKSYTVPETERTLEAELARYLAEDELKQVASTGKQGHSAAERAKRGAQGSLHTPGARDALPRGDATHAQGPARPAG